MKRTYKHIVAAVLSLILIASFFVLPAAAMDATGTGFFGNVIDDKCFYERAVKLPNGDLLATWCREFPIKTNWSGMKSYIFFKSSDNGSSWLPYSSLDPSNYDGLSRDKTGMPGLYVLPQAVGEYPAGTILFAVSDWDKNAQYCIHIWRSTDNGATWQRHGDLAARGADGTTVWEPEFIISSDGKLVCYYSDERQPGYDQCLALETSNDGGRTWGNYTTIVGTCDPTWVRGVDPSMWRPGMPRVAKLPNGTYFLAYENIAVKNNGIITCRTSSDGIHWGNKADLGTSVITSDGFSAYQCPMIACIDDGSANGRIILRGMNDNCSPSQCFTSTDAGQTWSLIDAPLTAIRNEDYGSSWSGTFIADGNRLFELNNAYLGKYNEIRCGVGYVYGSQLIVSNADYCLVNEATGYCIDDAAGSMEWGNELILWRANGLGTQQWHTDNVTGEYFNLVCNYSGLALDNPSGSTAAGTRMVQWDVNRAPAQQWRFVPCENGAFRIQNAYSGLYLDTENQSTAEHANLVQAAWNTSATQKWRVERVYEVARLRSSNISDCHVYHDASNKLLIANKSTTMLLSASQWKVVPGLADTGVSLISVDQPGYYLRHYEGQIILSKDDGSDLFKQDATWIQHRALDGSNGVSFESVNFPGQYIRHYDSYLRISPISTTIEKGDASFVMTMQ